MKRTTKINIAKWVLMLVFWMAWWYFMDRNNSTGTGICTLLLMLVGYVEGKLSMLDE